MDDYYKRYRGQLILRDLLAADRTQLANELTLLAYMRTALTLFIAGVSFIQFFDHLLVEIIGWLFVPLWIWLAWFGTFRFHRMKKPLDALLREAENEQQPSTVQEISETLSTGDVGDCFQVKS
jgi:putative membrane protein